MGKVRKAGSSAGRQSAVKIRHSEFLKVKAKLSWFNFLFYNWNLRSQEWLPRVKKNFLRCKQ